MTVKELIEKLQAFDPDATVVKETRIGTPYPTRIGLRHRHGAYDRVLNIVEPWFPEQALTDNQDKITIVVIT